MNESGGGLGSDLIIIVGIVLFAAILFYGLVSGEILLSLIVVVLLVIIKALYKILAALSRIEAALSREQ